MTALVGILNKRAAVMAADSAITVTNEKISKTYNTGEKLFRLSNHSVGVMIYSSVEFMKTPWDIIIKLYRAKNGNKEFKTLREYVDCFLDFIHEEDYFSSAEDQYDYLLDELSEYYHAIRDYAVDEARKELQSLGEDAEVDEIELLRKHLTDAFETMNSVSKDAGESPQFEKYSLNKFELICKDLFDSKLVEALNEDGLPADMLDDWKDGFYNYICSNYFLRSTGLVFVGYGAKDIYPSLLPIRISGAFDHRLRYSMDEEEKITNDNSASIYPFAQTDVIHSLLKGISPRVREFVDDGHEASLEKAKNKMIEAMRAEGVSEEVLAKMNEVDFDDIQEDYEETLSEQIREKSISGVVDAVESYNIEDMAKMAESLISVTNLHRHFSSSEESVGGPVDVAVITKTEGFVWVKRKQWFDARLNPQMGKNEE